MVALSPRLDLRQSQSLVMTPQLQQAIKLLALSSLEVESFITEEIEKNPLLESENIASSVQEKPARDISDVESSTASLERASDDVFSDQDFNGSEALDVNIDSDLVNQDCAADKIHTDTNQSAEAGLNLSGGPDNNGSFEGSEALDFDSFAAPDISLRDHLLMQAGASFNGSNLLIAQQIIDKIEATGYLEYELPLLAYQMGVEIQDMEQILSAIQTFDPIGVGARNLSECIAIQAKEADRYDPCMAKLIDNLDLVGKGAFDRLRRICQCDEEDLRDMLMELRNYDPKPGCKFQHDDCVAITPDIFVTAKGKGWSIELNSANLPRLLVNRSYYSEMSSAGPDKETKTWLNECIADANWLIKAMDQRQKTILKTVSEIIKQQDGFFRYGVSHLKPMTLRIVAEAIDMHESTISRVTSNKYLSCDRGVFELKYFFTSGVQNSDGSEGISAEAVKSAIKELIDNEGKKILSDDKLVALLRAQDFDIARRTVAKYREAMGIGSSVQRRREMKMKGG